VALVAAADDAEHQVLPRGAAGRGPRGAPDRPEALGVPGRISKQIYEVT